MTPAMIIDSSAVLDLAARLGWAVIHTLWQGALIALASAIVLRCMRRRSAAARHLVCLSALVLMFAAFCWSAARAPVRTAPAARAVSVQPAALPRGQIPRAPARNAGELAPASAAAVSPPGNGASPAAFASVPRAPWPQRLSAAIPWLGAFWLAGLSLVSFWRLLGWSRVRSWRHRGVSPARPAIQRVFDRLANELGLRKAVRVLESTRAAVPMVAGLIRPAVLLPARIVTGLGPREIEALLAHELAHLARRDTWAHFLQLCLETVLFFHPAVWWLGHRARLERELAADDLALRLRPARRDYAGALARLAELDAMNPSPALAATGGSLAARIRRILGQPPAPESGGSGWLALSFLVLGIAALFQTHRVNAAGEAKVVNVAAGESIQAAIDAAPEGATIRLGEGEWRERIRIAKPLTLEGAGWEKTRIVIAEPNAGEIGKLAGDLDAQRKAASTPEEKEKASAAWIEKIVQPAIWVRGVKAVTVRKLRVQGQSARGREDGGTRSALVYFQRAEATLSECAVTGPFGSGICVADESDVEIRGTLVAAIWMNGIVVTGASRDGSMAASRLHLVESDVRNVYHYGVAIGPGCDSTVIERCRISGTAWHGIRYDHASPAIAGNAIFKNARFGIYANGRTHAKVSGNLIWRNEMEGMWCLPGSTDRIEGNTFVGNLRGGLAVSGGARPVVARNIFAKQPVAIAASAVKGKPEAGAPELDANLYHENPVIRQIGTESKPAPEGSMLADPKFKHPEENDFTLAEDSPARAANIGAADPLPVASPRPLLAEEKAIIPADDTREYIYWTAPGSAKATKAASDLRLAAIENAGSIVADAFQLDDAAKRAAAIEQIRESLQSEDPSRVRTGLAAFIRVQQVEFDKASFRPLLRKLLDSTEADIRAQTLGALSVTGPSPEDLNRVLDMVDDPSGDVRIALPHAIKLLSPEGFTDRAGNAILKLLSGGDAKATQAVWHAMWGTKISPELEGRVVEASRKDDQGSGYSEVFYYALTVHLSKREPSVTRLIELTASQDTTNVAGRCLWGLQQGLARDQWPRVAELALKVIEARSDGYMRREALGCLRAFGTAAQAESLSSLIAKPGVTGEFKASLEAVLDVIKQRTEG